MTHFLPRRPVVRRQVLRGLLGGTSVAVALPLLDCWLNDNGTALAASGRPLPVRFGTWFWGCGMNPDRWNPSKTGADWEVTPELEPVSRLRDKLTILSTFNVFPDGKPNHVHATGWVGLRTGNAPQAPRDIDSPTFDILIADQIGKDTRFRQLDLTATGDPRQSFSLRSTGNANPAEPSPLAFYTRIFGPDFQDPNAADFKPDANTMVRRSVLSGIKDERDRLNAGIGAADRARLDEYFTSVRQLEQQLDMQLQKPAPLEACSVPKGAPANLKMGAQIDDAIANHKLLVALMAQALACNQTQVFNIVFADAGSTLRKAGSTVTHHQLTHEEPIDEKTGCQPEATFFVERIVEALGVALETMDSIKEGDGTLLDHMLLFAHSECSYAKIHSIETIPMFMAGKASGRIKTGIHVAGNGEPVTRVSLTVQQLMGVPINSYGAGAMATSKNIAEVVA
jgi:hypothetical protein